LRTMRCPSSRGHSPIGRLLSFGTLANLCQPWHAGTEAEKIRGFEAELAHIRCVLDGLRD